jgi:DHA2 family multidrug resistance protein
LSDNYSWHWCFLINGPVGLLALALIALIFRESARLQQEKGGFDLVGFLLVATFLGALEIMLDRGLEDDWFASNFIITMSAVCALAFVLMIPWEISRRNPMIDMRMVATRQFGCCFLVLATGPSLATAPSSSTSSPSNFRLHGLGRPRSLSPGDAVMCNDVRRGVSQAGQPKYMIIAGALIMALCMPF